MRARNENVYPGVLLDRTVIVTKDYIVDAFRVISDEEHQYDWAMHCVGDVPFPEDAGTINLGDRRGYMHLTDACLLPTTNPALSWQCGGRQVALHLVSPVGSQLILARDPLDPAKGQGGLAPLEPHSSLIARTRCRSVLFLALWQIGGEPLSFSLREGDTASDLVVRVQTGEGAREWRLPFERELFVVSHTAERSGVR